MKTLYLDNRAFSVSLGLLAFGFLFLVWFSYQRAETLAFRDTAEHVVAIANLQVDLVRDNVTGSERHVRFLHATPPVQGMVRASHNAGIDPLDDTPMEVWIQRLQTIFTAYARNNPNIAQIRYIGLAEHGRELVRVDRSAEGVKVIPDKELQTKGERDYFLASHNLKPGEVFFSNINLNREWGEIEQPPWPTYRVVQAVYDADGKQFGMIVLNFDVQPMMEALSRSIAQDLAVFLLNARGQFLLHPNPARSFEFEYGQHQGWESTYHESPREIAYRMFSMVENPVHPQERYFALKQTIGMPVGDGVRNLTLVSAMKVSAVQDLVHKRQINVLLIDFVLLLVVLALLVLYWMFSKKSLAELKVRAQFEAIVRGSNDIILGLDRSAQVVSCNQAALDLLGWQPDALADKRLADVVRLASGSDEAAQPLLQAFQYVCQGRQVEPVAVLLDGNTTERRYASVALSPIALSGREISGVAAIIRDVTEARNLQLHLQETNQALIDKNDEMERFIYTVSHDLKSPLVTIGGFTQSVLRDLGSSLDDKNSHRMKRVLANVDHMGDLLNDLLSLSRVVKAPMECGLCELTYCLDQVRDVLSEQIQNSQCEFVLEAAKGQVYANQKMLVQCLQNLIENAICYRHPERNPCIEIFCEKTQDWTRVTVKDNGLGIEEKHQQRIFRIFERLDTTIGEGTGVGLAIVKTIMEKHQGKIELTSTPGEGSAFSLLFPSSTKRNETLLNEGD